VADSAVGLGGIGSGSSMNGSLLMPGRAELQPWQWPPVVHGGVQQLSKAEPQGWAQPQPPPPHAGAPQQTLQP
jgi:hypothetical protein